MADETAKLLDEAEIPYQLRPHITMLRSELANALAYGQETRIAGARKQLAVLRVAEQAPKPTPATAAEKRAAAAEDTPLARTEAPAERKSPQERHATTTPGPADRKSRA